MVWDVLNEKKDVVKKVMRERVVDLQSSAEGRNKDLNSGMELLEMEFLLSVVENTAGNDEKDVTMRKLNFNEILRRGKQDQIDSGALVVYAMDSDRLYGKVIQCAATSELSKRTAK